MNVIETENLTKIYRSGAGVRDVSLQVTRGEIFGFLGANGAGKTTTIRLMLGLLHPTNGTIAVLGEKPMSKVGTRLRQEVGYLPGEMQLYEECKGIELLDFFAKARGKSPVAREKTLAGFPLSQAELRHPVKEYSRGMKQMLGITIAMQHDPRLLLMDEPTASLDPLMQLEVYRLLQQYVERGGTVFFSSHNIGEVEKICHRVAIIRRGRIVALEEVEKLRQRRVYRVEFKMHPEVKIKIPGLTISAGENGIFKGQYAGDIDDLLRRLIEMGKLEDFYCDRGRLEDIFLAYYEPGEGEYG